MPHQARQCGTAGLGMLLIVCADAKKVNPRRRIPHEFANCRFQLVNGTYWVVTVKIDREFTD
jgi:hypothetical protein